MKPQFYREAFMLGLRLLSPFCGKTHGSQTENLNIKVDRPIREMPRDVHDALVRIGWVLADNGSWSLSSDGFSQRFNPHLADLMGMTKLPQ